MDLANIENVVYAMIDPGQGHIGNILYKLHRDGGESGAPRPIKADFLDIYDEILAAYDDFGGHTISENTRRPSVTSFLRSVKALAAYRGAASQFEELTVQHGENRTLWDNAMKFREEFNNTELRDAVFGE